MLFLTLERELTPFTFIGRPRGIDILALGLPRGRVHKT
jgi:hypothetical protein